jgi:hypothetical protein
MANSESAIARRGDRTAISAQQEGITPDRYGHCPTSSVCSNEGTLARTPTPTLRKAAVRNSDRSSVQAAGTALARRRAVPEVIESPQAALEKRVKRATRIPITMREIVREPLR